MKINETRTIVKKVQGGLLKVKKVQLSLKKL